MSRSLGGEVGSAVALGLSKTNRVGVRLGVNVDHVATVREARRAAEPDPVAAAVLAELGGAHQITIHLREDRRHIKDRDLEILRKTVRSRLNLEMAATEEMARIAIAAGPDSVTLVPERREEITTEGGLDVAGTWAQLAPAVAKLANAGITVNAFIDPETPQIDAAAEAKFNGVELHTGAYANAPAAVAKDIELERIGAAAAHGARRGLFVAAGHGLTYVNVKPVVHVLEIAELNIGHSIVSRAVLVGMERAVAEMLALIREAEAERRAGS